MITFKLNESQHHFEEDDIPLREYEVPDPEKNFDMDKRSEHCEEPCEDNETEFNVMLLQQLVHTRELEGDEVGNDEAVSPDAHKVGDEVCGREDVLNDD